MVIELQGYKIELPDAPATETIDGYKKPRLEQYWIPPYNYSDKEFAALPEYEQEKIKEQEFHRRVHGYWFMNKGNPFYLTGDNYFFLTHWTINRKKPDFIIGQAHDFYFDYMVDRDEFCVGSIKLKPRREGCTQRTMSRLINKATLLYECDFGIQSKTYKDAKKVNFKALKHGFKFLPYWMKPKIKNLGETVIEFGEPYSKTTKGNQPNQFQDVDDTDTLDTSISIGAGEATHYDGEKLRAYVGDEISKWKEADFYETWGIVSTSLYDGMDLIGKAYLLSTIGETTPKAAENFVKIWKESDPTPSKRNELGFTTSGLYRWFISPIYSKRGTDKRIDPKTGLPRNKPLINKYGETDEVAIRELLLARRRAITNPKKLFIEIKQNPLSVDEALNFGAGTAVFDTFRINERRTYLRDLEPTEERPQAYRVGNLAWVNNIRFGKVTFVDNPQGKWKIAYFPQVAGVDMVNRWKVMPNGRKIPYSDTQFVMGIDPFDYNAEDMAEGEHSKGAFLVKLKYNYHTPDLSNIYCCQYFYREADASMFYEDCIKTAMFYGARMNPERKLYGIWRYLRDNGLIGFSMIRPDATKQSDSQKRDNAYGTPTGADTLRLGAELVENYIAKPDPMYNENLADNLERFWFEETLEQLSGYDPKQSTKYDLAVAMFLTEIGCQAAKHMTHSRNETDKEDILSVLFPRFDNSGTVARPIY